MTIAAAIVKQMVWGRLRVHFGTYLDSGAATADDIDTGLRRCAFMITWEKKATAPTDVAGVNEDFTEPIDGSAVNMIASGAAGAGYWLAFGIGRTKGVG